MDEIEIYLKEDLGEEGDITSDALFSNEEVKAKIICKNNCIIAGLDELKIVFEKTGAITKTMVKDGDYIKKDTVVAEIHGLIRSILKGERLALNIIGRMSSIATETNKIVKICRKINPNIQIAATRKTTPGFRKFEKKAVAIGGGISHRFGLFDAVMIKDNHIKAFGSVEEAVKKIKENVKNKIVEVEVENQNDAITVAKMNIDVIMLDNFKPKTAKILSEQIREINPNVLIEISGGITPDNISGYVSFADRISLGYLTHSVKNIDFSLEMT